MGHNITASRAARAAAGALLAALATVGGTSLVAQGRDDEPQPVEPLATATTAAQTNSVTTSSTTFDPTVLTKFIPAKSFVASQGAVGSLEADTVDPNGINCVTSASSGATGSVTELDAGVELPNGSRIKRIRFFGTDNAGQNVGVTLDRVQFSNPLFGSVLRTDTRVDDFNTAGATPGQVIVDGFEVNELVGTLASTAPIAQLHRFHSIHVTLANAAGANHVLCGVEVDYQVPVQANPGVVFFPVAPYRAFDSRIAAYPQTGILASNGTKVISIADSHDLTTGAVLSTNLVPAGATAIAYNVTVAQSGGPNFVAVTPGDAATFGVSTINFNGVMNVANGATVAIAADRTIKLFAGPGPATHIIVDVTGYYAPYIPPNMGN